MRCHRTASVSRSVPTATLAAVFLSPARRGKKTRPECAPPPGKPKGKKGNGEGEPGGFEGGPAVQEPGRVPAEHLEGVRIDRAQFLYGAAAGVQGDVETPVGHLFPGPSQRSVLCLFAFQEGVKHRCLYQLPPERVTGRAG